MPLARKVETATLARVSKVKVTCSAARSIKRKGVSAAPLRSPQHPMGLPSLQGSDLEKVFAANKIYVGLANFLDLLCSLKIPWTVENPESSLLWQLPCFEHLVRAYPRVSFDMCCYGGARLTHRSLLTSCPAIDHLRQRCPGGHKHLPWKPFRKADGSMRFPTQEEAAYPRPFCQQFVFCLFSGTSSARCPSILLRYLVRWLPFLLFASLVGANLPLSCLSTSASSPTRFMLFRRLTQRGACFRPFVMRPLGRSFFPRLLF